MKDPLIEPECTWFLFVVIALATFRIWWVVRFGTGLRREAYWEYVTTQALKNASNPHYGVVITEVMKGGDAECPTPDTRRRSFMPPLTTPPRAD